MSDPTEQPSLGLRLRRFAGPLIANRYTGRLAALVLRNRIPHRGLVLDTSSPLITDEIKASLLVGSYESAEYRFVCRYLPRDADCVELGGSMGMMSCTIARHLDPGRRLVTVEADPRLAAVLRRNLDLNGCADRVTVEPVAIYYGEGETVAFGIGENSVAGRIGESAATLSKVEVPARTLARIIADAGLTRYSIVADIEGIEWQVIAHDRAALLGAQMIVLETHDGPDGEAWRDLVAQLRADPDFELVDQYGCVLVLRPRRAGGAQ